MSRGPGHVQQFIYALLSNPRCYGTARAWTVEQLAARLYSDPCHIWHSHDSLGLPRGFHGVEKRHRVAILRALKTMRLFGTWRAERTWPHDLVVLCDPCDLQSMLDRDLLVEGGDEVRPARADRIKEEVAMACRYRDGTKAEREAVMQEREDARRAEDEGYDRQRAAIVDDVYGSPDAEQGKRITQDLRVSHDDAPRTEYDPADEIAILEKLHQNYAGQVANLKAQVANLKAQVANRDKIINTRKEIIAEQRGVRLPRS